jgi:hypothetical protein
VQRYRRQPQARAVQEIRSGAHDGIVKRHFGNCGWRGQLPTSSGQGPRYSQLPMAKATANRRRNLAVGCTRPTLRIPPSAVAHMARHDRVVCPAPDLLSLL